MTMMDPRKAYFDAARAADEDGVLVLDDINKIHAALDAAGVPRAEPPPIPVSEPGGPDTVGKAGIGLVKYYEGCQREREDGRFQAYLCPAGIWTIGWGATGKGIGPGTIWTQEQCDKRLERDLRVYANDVARAIGNTRTSQAQFDALVSFHYNTGAIGRATLTKKHRQRDFEGAAREFKRWNRGGGVVLRGLVRRRASEEKLYRSGM